MAGLVHSATPTISGNRPPLAEQGNWRGSSLAGKSALGICPTVLLDLEFFA